MCFFMYLIYVYVCVVTSTINIQHEYLPRQSCYHSCHRSRCLVIFARFDEGVNFIASRIGNFCAHWLTLGHYIPQFIEFILVFIRSFCWFYCFQIGHCFFFCICFHISAAQIIRPHAFFVHHMIGTYVCSFPKTQFEINARFRNVLAVDRYFF